MNKQQLPEFERGAAFIFKYQVVTSESESQIRLFSPFPTLPDVNIDSVSVIVLESNEKLSRMQHRVTQAGCNNNTFNESHIPVLQQMENMYNHLKTEINEAQSELNTPIPLQNLSSHQQHLSEPLDKNAQLLRKNLTTEHDDSMVLSQHSPLVPDSSWVNQLKM